MAPSALYSRLHDLAKAHAIPSSLDELYSIRHSSATHAWGHSRLVQQNPGLQDIMDNAAFAAHIASTGRYLTSSQAKQAEIHNIIVDEYERRAVIRMSYYLQAKGTEEIIEQDIIWMLKFTDEAESEQVLIKESIEFIDASSSARAGTLVRSVHGEIGNDVRGGITLKE